MSGIDADRLAKALDDLALMHTGRSLGVLGSARIVDDLLDADGGPLAYVLAELDRLREEVQRVEALAERLDDESREFYYANRYTHEQGINYVSGMRDGMEQIADRILDALNGPTPSTGSTDTGPAPTTAQTATQEAGDGV
jgi:hypothetical protein